MDGPHNSMALTGFFFSKGEKVSFLFTKVKFRV